MRKLLAILICFVPVGMLRIFLYRWLLGYKIPYAAKIAPFNFILAKECVLGNVNIGYLNYFNVDKLQLDDGVRVVRFNRFKLLSSLHVGKNTNFLVGNVAFGTRTGVSPFKEYEALSFGDSCVVTNRHIFDLSESINIGNDVTIGGEGSQFWTHGFDLDHVKIQAGIKIGDRVYVGSRSMILQGVAITDNVSIGAGTVVSKSLNESGFYVSSNLISKGNPKLYDSSSSLVVHNGFKFVRKEP